LKLPHEYYSGKFRHWWYQEIPWQTTEAYDLIFHSGELEKLSNEVGLDVKKRIENDLFRKSVEFVLEFSSLLSNVEMNTMACMIAVGRAIGEPRYVHEALHRVNEFLEWRFSRDGTWMEFSGYHFPVIDQILNLNRVVRGYTDPPGYIDPKYHNRYEEVNLEKSFPMVFSYNTKIYDMYYPNGVMPSLGDTFYKVSGQNSHKPASENVFFRQMPGPTLERELIPLKESKSGILPGPGYAWLGMGKGADQVQAHLNFSETAGHAHDDGLNLTLFALGHQMLPDLGYTQTKMRWWTWGTLAHNTVLVNGLSQQRGREIETAGDLLLYDKTYPGIPVVEASNERRYNTIDNNLVDLYRRLLILWDFGGNHPILIDVFRVIGGNRHEWIAHGPIYEQYNASISIQTKPIAGTLLGEDESYDQAVAFLQKAGRYDVEKANKLAGEANPRYGFIHDLKRGESDQFWRLTFSPEDKNSEAKLALNMLGGQHREMIIGLAPAVFPEDRNDEKSHESQAPILLAKRKSQKELMSVFPVIWEAYKNKPLISEMSPLTIEGGNELDIAFVASINNDARKLLVVSLYNPDSLDVKQRRMHLLANKKYPLKFAGDLLVGILKNNRLQDIHIWNGISMISPDDSLKYDGQGVLRGELTEIIRPQKKFLLSSDQIMPEKIPLASCLLVKLPDGKQEGFLIKNWNRSSDNHKQVTVTLQNDPGLEGNARAGTLQRVTYPQKVFKPVTYTGLKWKLPVHHRIQRDNQETLKLILNLFSH
jgi:hypothetical protein